MAGDGARSLAGGAVIETRLCARLLGVKILVIDGAITVWPARAELAEHPAVVPQLAEHPSVVPPASGEPAGGRLQSTAERLDGTADRLRRLG